MRVFFFVFLLQSLCLSAFSQTKKVEGTVTDSKGNPLDKVSVIVKGSKTGVTTDALGHFSLNADDNSVLVFSSAAFTTREESVGTKVLINVSLLENAQSLENVVV